MMKEWDVQLENANSLRNTITTREYVRCQKKFDGLATASLSSQLGREFRAARNNQNINTSDDVKELLFQSCDGVTRIALFEQN